MSKLKLLMHLWTVSSTIEWILGGFLALMILSVLVFYLLRERTIRQNIETELHQLTDVLQNIRNTQKLETNLNTVLRVLSTIIQAPYYAAYVLDNRSQRYVLRTVSHPFDDFNGMGPAYSGLALPKREAYLPPMVLESIDTYQSVQKITDGEVPLIVLQTAQRSVLIRIGPIKEFPRGIRSQLRTFLRKVNILLDDLVETELERMRAELATTANAAVNRVASLATDMNSAIDIIVKAFSGIAGGLGGIMMESDNEITGTVYGVGETAHLSKALTEDKNAYHILSGLLQNRMYHVFTRTNADFYNLPSYLSTYELGAIAIVRIQGRGLLLFFYSNSFDETQFVSDGVSQIRVLADQLSNISMYRGAQRNLSKSYAKVLWGISDMVDSFNPYTVGYSDMMTRYSLALGEALGMTSDELTDLALAAHLSNIGVLGINMDLLVKEGKYTEFEYETMKMHCEIGASMIQVSTGNQRAASFVLHHHERVDGLGFPMRLKASAIPLGARVLHVVQVFLAKVNGRGWRSPLSFEEALETLKRASGTQLDGDVVKAFIEWWRNKQADASAAGTSLAKCHELLCVPKSICESCPVYTEEKLNCWEVGNNLCKAHGRECATCFVRTEYLFRQQGGGPPIGRNETLFGQSDR